MKNGILVPAAVVRVLAGAVVVGGVALAASLAPDTWRYLKMRTL